GARSARSPPSIAVGPFGASRAGSPVARPSSMGRSSSGTGPLSGPAACIDTLPPDSRMRGSPTGRACHLADLELAQIRAQARRRQAPLRGLEDGVDRQSEGDDEERPDEHAVEPLTIE